MHKNSFRRKIISLITVILCASIYLDSQARINAQQLEFVTGTNEELRLLILASDLELDLASKNPQLRMMIDAEPLLVQKTFPQDFQIKTFSYGIDGEKQIHNTLNYNIQRKNRTRVKFTIDLAYIQGDKDYYFEVFDSAGTLVNTYRQTINFSNIQEQVEDIVPIEVADCDNTSFNQCHLDYVMDKISFVLDKQDSASSAKIKNPNGSYDVVLSIPKSVQEQIRSGNFSLKDLTNNNLSDMRRDDNESPVLIELDVRGQANFHSGINISQGAADGYVLTSDAYGNASWQPISSISPQAGVVTDELVKTELVRANTLDVTTVEVGAQIHSPTIKGDNIDIEGSLEIRGDLQYETGARDGYVLTSDAEGNASWQAPKTLESLSFDMPETDAGRSITIDWQEAHLHEITLHGDVILSFSQNPSNTANLTLIINQDQNGFRQLSYPASVKWPSGKAPELSLVAGAVDRVDCLFNANSQDYLCHLTEADYQ